MDPEQTVAGFGVQPGMRVADFGAGAGFFSIFLAKAVGADGQVTAIDVLEEALEAVRAKAKQAGLENIATVRSNLELPGSSGLADGSQDLVLLKNMLFQSPDKAPIIAEAARVVKPGGALIVIDWRPGGGPGTASGERASGLGPPDDLRVAPETVEQLAAAAGLTGLATLDPDAYHFGRRFSKP